MNSNGYNFCAGTVDGHIYTYDMRFDNDVPLSSFKAHDSVVHCIKYLQNVNVSNNSSMISKYNMSSNSINNNLTNGQQHDSNNSIGHMKRSNSYNCDLQQNLGLPLNNHLIANLGLTFVNLKF